MLSRRCWCGAAFAGVLLALPGQALAREGGAAAANDDEGIINVRTDDRRMNAAKAKARRTLTDFLAALAQPGGGRAFEFKYPLAGWEHIWVDRVERHGDRLVGRLANEPAEPGFRLGQRVTVPLAEISDWGYRDADGVMHGHFTTRVLLAQMNPAQARAIRENFGWTRPPRATGGAGRTDKTPP